MAVEGSSTGEGPARAAYGAAGVDVAAGDRAVHLMREHIERAGAGGLDLLGGLGGFAAALPLPPGFRQPVIVSATDGVGTKTELARRLGRHDTIGQDLVAMCADDVACHGARPFFFLDYLAVGRLDPAMAAELVGGIARACAEVGCSLAGGETAEHPGLMEPGAFDLAGFCVGVVERDELLDGTAARPGDAVLGICSSGLHANGFSLVRQVIEEHGLDLDEPMADVLERVLGRGHAEAGGADEPGADEPGVHQPGADEPGAASLGLALLRPTRLYASRVLSVRRRLLNAGLRLSGLAHVTGGGMPGNLPRAVGPDLGVRVDPGRWPVPSVIRLVAALAALPGEEMRATFNAGIGMAMVVEPEAVGPGLALLAERGLPAWHIGEVRPAVELPAGRYLEVAG